MWQTSRRSTKVPGTPLPLPRPPMPCPLWGGSHGHSPLLSPPAQLHDLLQLRQENSCLTTITKQIAPYVRSIAKVKERLEPR